MKKIAFDSDEADDTSYRYNRHGHSIYDDGREYGRPSHYFTIRYNRNEEKGERYRVLAGCRDFSIVQALEHWGNIEHHSHERRMKTLRKLFKLYKVERRRIPKQYREVLGYRK